MRTGCLRCVAFGGYPRAMRGAAYVRALSAALRGAALPYGYTLTVWGAGQALIHLHGTPNVGQMALFVGGAVTAYGLLKSLARERSAEVEPQIGSPHFVRAGVVHLAAIGSAIGAAALLGGLDSGVAWPAGGFAATLLYIVVATVELGLLETEDERAS